MSILSPKKLIKQLLAKQGYEFSLYPIAKSPYTGPKLALVHIAKCGGSSVDFALRSALASPQQHRIERQATIASSMASFNEKIPFDINNNNFNSSGVNNADFNNCDFSEHHAKHLSQIFTYYLQQNWQYISGHITINNHIIQQFKNEYAFITILRDPVERFISNYIFNKLTNRMDIMPPNCLTTDNVIDEAKAILNSKRGWQMANSPTMYLTGRYPKDIADAKKMQAEVAENLSYFKVIGFLDDLTQFEKDCQQLTGRSIAVGNRNKTQQFNSHWQIKTKALLKAFFSERATKGLVEKLCHFEMENYKIAKEIK